MESPIQDNPTPPKSSPGVLGSGDDSVEDKILHGSGVLEIHTDYLVRKFTRETNHLRGVWNAGTEDADVAVYKEFFAEKTLDIGLIRALILCIENISDEELISAVNLDAESKLEKDVFSMRNVLHPYKLACRYDEMRAYERYTPMTGRAVFMWLALNWKFGDIVGIRSRLESKSFLEVWHDMSLGRY